MSSLLPFRRGRSAKEEAGQWIARIDRGLSGDERRELDEWLQAGRHRELLMRLAEDWDCMAVVAELAELFPLRGAEGADTRLIWRVAAALLLATVLAAAFYWRPQSIAGQSSGGTARAVPRSSARQAAVQAVYSTAIGERRTLELPDHSRIRLNTNTELRIEFSDGARLLTMSRGEAMFEVAKDPARVFTVRVAGYEFKAIGTAFDIRAESPSGLQLTVTEGRVRVHQRPEPVAEATGDGEAPTVFEDATDVVVEANRAVSIAQRSERIDALTPEQVAAAIAWQRGAIVFTATPLSQVIDEFARYSTERFVIADPALANIPVSGYFEVGDVDAFGAALQQNVHVTMTKHNGYLLLSRSDQRR